MRRLFWGVGGSGHRDRLGDVVSWNRASSPNRSRSGRKPKCRLTRNTCALQSLPPLPSPLLVAQWPSSLPQLLPSLLISRAIGR